MMSCIMPLKNGLRKDVPGMFHLSIIRECSCFMDLSLKCSTSPRHMYLGRQVPIYAQLNFTKYFTETFIHVINFMGKWPLAFRRLIQRNCAVNLSGWLCNRIRCICGGRNSPATESLCISYVYISLFACCSRLF